MANTYINNDIGDEKEKKLKTLIEALTHSGATNLEESLFKEVKKICKSSNIYVSKTYNLVLKQLQKKNSQIRLIAFQMCKELFNRSTVFRECVLKDLKLIFELTAETNPAKKLPPPKSFAKNLKILAVSTLKKWVEDFGEEYTKLKVAYNYFKNCQKTDFETLQIGNSTEQVVESEQQRHIQEVHNGRMKKLIEDINNNESEIHTTITTLSNCLNLLLPPLEDFFVPECNLQNSFNVQEFQCDKKDEPNENDLRQFGITPNYSLSLEFSLNDKIKIIKNEENNSIIENAKDCVVLINNRFLPMVKKWLHTSTKYSNGNTNELKKILDLKEKLESTLKKYTTLLFEDDIGNHLINGSDNSSDDDFEEVKKEGYEEVANFSEEEDLTKMSCFQQDVNKITPKLIDSLNTECSSKGEATEPIPSTSNDYCPSSQNSDRKSKLMAVAPKLPFDIDLYHWEDEELKAPTLLSTKIDVDKFWGSCNSDDIHEIPNPEGIAALRTRVIEFTGTFEPVKWSCRAPLPNGKLCPRKDRQKCPFHGKIVPRDEFGKCQNKEDEKVTSEVTPEYSHASWQDPELLRELKRATGIDLKMPEKKGKRKKSGKKNLTHKKMKTSSAALRLVEEKKLPGLIDVVRKQNDSYRRLCKKIFNRSSLKRVSSVLNKIDRNKYRDKFGDQFNYV